GGAPWAQPHETGPGTTSRRSVFIRRPYHWQEDAPPLVALEDSIIYEVHVRSGAPRHLRRPGREDPLPEGTGRHGGRAAANPRVRRERLPLHQPGDGA